MRIGFDIGGTKIASAIFDENGNIEKIITQWSVTQD